MAWNASKPRRNAPSRSARAPMVWSDPSSTTSSIVVPRKSAPQTERRSCTPISVIRAITIRGDDLAQTPDSRPAPCPGPSRHGQGLRREGLGHHEWLGLLLDREASWRRDKRLAARLRIAKLRQQASIEDVDYRSPRGLDRALFQKLAKGEWIEAHDNLALVGPTGVGKSWLASALGHKACRDNRSVLYHRLPKLFEDLTLARGDGRHPRICARSGAPICSSSTIGDWSRSTAPPVTTSSKSSRNDTAAVRPSSPLNSPWSAGTKS